MEAEADRPDLWQRAWLADCHLTSVSTSTSSREQAARRKQSGRWHVCACVCVCVRRLTAGVCAGGGIAGGRGLYGRGAALSRGRDAREAATKEQR